MGESKTQDLATFIVEEVRRQTSSEAMQQSVEKKIEGVIKEAIDEQFRSWGDINKQIKVAVADSLRVGNDLNLPSYGNMVMALLRKKIDEIVCDLVSQKLDAEMTEILKVAPKETKFSEIVAALVDEQDKQRRYSDHVTCIVEPSDYSDLIFISLDPEDKQKRYQCETQLVVDKEGKVQSLTLDQKDMKKVITSGPYHGYQKMIFAIYASGAKLIMDELDPPTSIGDY